MIRLIFYKHTFVLKWLSPWPAYPRWPLSPRRRLCRPLCISRSRQRWRTHPPGPRPLPRTRRQTEVSQWLREMLARPGWRWRMQQAETARRTRTGSPPQPQKRWEFENNGIRVPLIYSTGISYPCFLLLVLFIIYANDFVALLNAETFCIPVSCNSPKLKIIEEVWWAGLILSLSVWTLGRVTKPGREFLLPP